MSMGVESLHTCQTPPIIALPPTECYPIGDQSYGGLHAQSNLRSDHVHGVNSCQRRKCSGDSSWRSGRCRGRWSGGRPGGCRRGRRRRSGYRHGRRDSWSSTDSCSSSTDSCSRYEHVHKFWRHASHGKKVRGRPQSLTIRPISSEKGSGAFILPIRSCAGLESDQLAFRCERRRRGIVEHDPLPPYSACQSGE